MKHSTAALRRQSFPLQGAQVIGHLGAPFRPRGRPYWFAPAVFDPSLGLVHFGPFRFERDQMLYRSTPWSPMPLRAFAEAASWGHCTRCEPVPLRADFYCFYPPHSKAMEHVHVDDLALRLRTFRAAALESGDQAYRDGCREEALSFYVAVACTPPHPPEAYARMLLCDMSPSRRSRIHGLLIRASAPGASPEEYISSAASRVM